LPYRSPRGGSLFEGGLRRYRSRRGRSLLERDSRFPAARAWAARLL